MATTISIQPANNAFISTLLPVYYKISDSSTDTTNIIAKCFQVNQTTAVFQQIGGAYRLAPSLTTAGEYRFDASEAFNTVTKWTLGDMPNSLKFGSNTGTPSTMKVWTDVATFYVYVQFFREYLDATTGLIVVDPSPVTSNANYIHGGCPNKDFLMAAVPDNGINMSPYHYINANWNGIDNYKRWITNYPIKINSQDGARESFVDIHESESYTLFYLANRTSYSASCDYVMQITTYNADGSTLGTHGVTITGDYNLQSIWVGFRDIVNGFVATGAEGTDFINVARYKVEMTANTTTTASCAYQNILTRYWFKVSRKCIKNTGYLRFVFKNMLGGYDCVTSEGKFTKKTKNKFEDFEKSLGYFNWNEAMEFGNSNWANQNVERYTVTTELKKPELAEHFAEMLSSTDVYLRVANDSSKKVSNGDLSQEALEQPYFFYPIVIKAGNTNVNASQDGLMSIKFSFEMAVNQRNPRY